MASCSPDIKLTYFDMTGIAETIRLAFYIADVSFVDERIAFADWPKLKPSTPFGGLPIMVMDGKTYAQSRPLLRYAGKRTGIHPDDPLAALEIEMIVDGLYDIFVAMGTVRQDKDPQSKVQRQMEFKEKIFPHMMSSIDDLVGKTNPNYCIGESLTIADLMLYNVLDFFQKGVVDFMPKDCTKPYANSSKIHDHVVKHGKVAQWRQKHS
uniref:Glutathione transferase n=1 Tax=Spongospora subterranea TaxID=70186 RepID=A0A0H5R8U0_9EUKA|eukprot:CRZ10543.1 hypothetical protein [Spongospora subterranea]